MTPGILLVGPAQLGSACGAVTPPQQAPCLQPPQGFLSLTSATSSPRLSSATSGLSVGREGTGRGRALGTGCPGARLEGWRREERPGPRSCLLSFLITCNLPAGLPSNQMASILWLYCSSGEKVLSPALLACPAGRECGREQPRPGPDPGARRRTALPALPPHAAHAHPHWGRGVIQPPLLAPPQRWPAGLGRRPAAPHCPGPAPPWRLLDGCPPTPLPQPSP